MPSIRAILLSTLLALTGSVVLSNTAQAVTLSTVGTVMTLNATSDSTAKKPRKARAAKKSKGGNISFNDGSAESRSDRDRRLQRECKGRSNSGVCEGYTR
jgi:hypothetical protein